MKIDLYFTDERYRFNNVHSLTIDDENITITYTDLKTCLFHTEQYSKDQIDRITIREVSL